MEALAYFTLNSWTFVNDKFMGLNDLVLQQDYKEFSYRKLDFDVYEYCKQAMLGGKLYLLHENIEDADNGKKRIKKLV